MNMGGQQRGMGGQQGGMGVPTGAMGGGIQGGPGFGEALSSKPTRWPIDYSRWRWRRTVVEVVAAGEALSSSREVVMDTAMVVGKEAMVTRRRSMGLLGA